MHPRTIMRTVVSLSQKRKLQLYANTSIATCPSLVQLLPAVTEKITEHIRTRVIHTPYCSNACSTRRHSELLVSDERRSLHHRNRLSCLVCSVLVVFCSGYGIVCVMVMLKAYSPTIENALLLLDIGLEKRIHQSITSTHRTT